MFIKKISNVILLASMTTSMSSFASNFKSVPGELIVKLKNNHNISSFFNTAKDLELIESIEVGSNTVYRVRHNLALEKNSLIESLGNNASVVYAEPNYIYSINNYELNDPKFSSLWGMKNTGSNEPNSRTPGVSGADINAIKAWEITTGSKNIKIAVIDTGVDYEHEDLKDNIWTNEEELNGVEGVDDDGNGYVDDIHGYDFANNDGDPMDDNKHGTHVSGTIGAIHNNGVGVAGVMANVSIVGVKFLTASGSGSLANAVKAINYATKIGVNIMSNSWGGGGFSQTMKDAIVAANNAGIIFTAAAGNSASNNDSKPQYPASYKVDNVISVAALTAQDSLASFSSYGKKSVHIGAPGHRILSTVPGNGYEVFSGTSMATPHVSGALGLLLSLNSELSPLEVKERLMMTSVPISALRSKTITAGRMDLVNLLNDERPYRNMPKPGKWVSVKLDNNWESAHPYEKNSDISETFTIPNAKFIRVSISKLDIEKKYDYLIVSDKSRSIVEKIWGTAENFSSDYIEGDTINLNFKSDSSVSKWGFKIENVEVQY